MALLGLLASPALAEKTDVVVMDNGNVIVGEIKKMVRGLLEFSVDDISGRLQIEWEHVVRLTSKQQLDFELEDGTHYFGSLIESSADGELRIQTAAGEFEIICNEFCGVGHHLMVGRIVVVDPASAATDADSSETVSLARRASGAGAGAVAGEGAMR